MAATEDRSTYPPSLPTFLTAKRVCIVGATSGIGRALAERFLTTDSTRKVVVTGRRTERLKEIEDKWGRDRVRTVRFDMTDLDALEDNVAKAMRAFVDDDGEDAVCDAIILNGGHQRQLDFTKPESLDLNKLDLEWKTNYQSILHQVKYSLTHLNRIRDAGGVAHLVTVTSSLSLVPQPRMPNYCATKAAVHHFTLALRRQLQLATESDPAGPQVRVTEIVPPLVMSELHDEHNQPELAWDKKGYPPFQMDLDEFVNFVWQDGAKGGDEVIAGLPLSAVWEAVEKPRKRLLGKFLPPPS